MTTSKFYRSRIASLTKTEKLFAGQYLDEDSPYTQGIADIDFVTTKPLHTPIRTRRLADRKGDDYQITYNFPRSVRINALPKGEYGASGVTFRMLYELLCRYYSGGEYFVDTYFDSVFRLRAVYLSFILIRESIYVSIDDENEALERELHRKADSTADMRFKTSKEWASFSVWQNKIIKKKLEDLGNEIREDITICIRSGILPFGKKSISKETLEKRRRLSLSSTAVYYATGQLLKSLHLYIEIEPIETLRYDT